MGEATYYIKGDNCDKETFERIRKLFEEGSRAEEWWQNHRNYENNGKREKFWEEFDKEFPLVVKYLKFIGFHGGDCNNNLAGILNFGQWEYEQENFQLNGNEMRYCACVWHFADWDHIKNYLQSREFGLKNVRWLSDEDTNDLFDLL